MKTDRFGNPIVGDLPYARGNILKSTEEDFRKLQKAWRIIGDCIAKRGKDSVYNFTGLERILPVEAEDLAFMDDELSPALNFEKFRKIALEHLGGDPVLHDIALFNRMTAATLSTFLTLVKPGETVLGVSATYSHASIIRAAAHVGAKFIDTTGVEDFAEALEAEKVSLVALSRLAVTYDILSLDDMKDVVNLAKRRGVTVYVDDAGGARVGPAIFNQPKMLELGVDVGATGLDKYGTFGPRLGLIGGRRELVTKIRAKAFEFGLEARPMLYIAALRSLEKYRPERVVELVTSTKRLAAELRLFFGEKLHETPVTAQLLAENILEITMKRVGITKPTIVPYEAVAALAMILLQDYSIITVHFAGLPPGTANVLFKFIPPETMERFGGARKLAQAVNASMDKLTKIIQNPDDVRKLLLD